MFGKSTKKQKSLLKFFEVEGSEEASINTPAEDLQPTSQYTRQENTDIDPLDAYMQSVDETVRKESESNPNSFRPEILGYDDSEEELNTIDRTVNLSDDEEYDENYDDRESKAKKKVIEPLPKLDHTTVAYKSFRRDCYREHPEIKIKSDSEREALRENLCVSVKGNDIPCPYERFEHACFDVQLLKEIYNSGYQRPTPIQAQAIPIALQGRNLIALAKTGSGKTMAYIWPMIVHVRAQTRLTYGEGPIAIILAPTRELVVQIYQKANKFCKISGITLCPVYGGAGKYEMSKALREGPEVVVASPGRLIEMVKLNVTNFYRCTLIILDEADRMFDLAKLPIFQSFERQITSIINNIRGDRQVLLFSATMKRRVEDFVRQTIEHPSSGASEIGAGYTGDSKGLVRLVIGRMGEANNDIQQVPVILRNADEKWKWLTKNIEEFIAAGKVLLFVSEKLETEEMTKNLNYYFNQRQLSVNIKYLHGDVDQNERLLTVKKFSKSSGLGSEVSILVATDIAARGLDIKDINTVINYEAPKNIESYVHRIGRTGRLGIDGVKPGTAYTLLLNPKDSSFAFDLIQNLNISQQTIPSELQLLAEIDPKWSKIKHLNRGTEVKGRGGLGTSTQTAMTSEMLANSTKRADSSISSSINFSRLLGTSGINNISLGHSSQTPQSWNNSINFDNEQKLPAPLKGFIRSSQTLSSVSTLPEVNQSGPTQTISTSVSEPMKIGPRKRSRWDN